MSGAEQRMQGGDDDLRAFDVVFCDSLAALAWARARGLPASSRIRSSSPRLLMETPGAEEVEAGLPPGHVSRFIGALNKSVLGIFEELRRAGFAHPLAIAAAYGVFGYHRSMRAALTLTEDDLARPRLVLRPRTGDNVADRFLAPIWPELLATNPAARVVDVEVARPDHGSTLGGRPPDLLERAANLRPGRMLYRFLLFLYEAGLRMPGQRREVLILRDGNELVRDTALAFALSGARIRQLPVPRVAAGTLDKDQSAMLRRVVSDIVESGFGGFYSGQVLEVVKAGASDWAEREMATAVVAEAAWRATLAKAAQGRGQAILLHGFPSGGANAGLHLAAGKCNVKVVGFQHGVRREIAYREIDTTIVEESNLCDLMICYNEVAARCSGRTSPFSAADAVAAGMPSDYVRPIQRRPTPSPQPLLYVSTLLYRGTTQISYTAVSDFERASREIALIDNVLSKLPYRVLYKPYPAFRYADRDPVLERAAGAANIDLFTEEVDLRYMVRSHRVIMTSGATSTVGWCAASGLPVVFIDDRDVAPLNEPARKLFGEALFLFDRPSGGLHGELCRLLDRPLEDVEQEARVRRARVGDALENFFGFDARAAGRKAKRIIEQHFTVDGAARSR